MGGRPKPFDQQGVAKKKGKARKNRMDDTSENGQQSQNSEMGTDQSAPLSRRYKIHDPKNTAPSQGSGDSFESKTSDQADGAHHGLHPMSPTISVSSNAVSSTSTDHDSCHGPRQVNMSSRRFGNSPSGFNPEAPIFDGTASQYRRQLAQQQAQSGHSEPAFAPPFYGQSMYQSHQYENSQPVVTNNFPEGPTFLPGQHASSATYFPQSTVYAPQQVVVYPYPQQQLQAGSYESFGRYNSTNYFTTGATLGPTAPVYNPQELYYGQPLQPHPQQGLQNAQYSESVTSSLGVDASSCSPTQTEDAITGMMSPSAQSASDALPDTGCSYTGQFYMRDATEPIIHDYLARCQLRLGSLGARIKFYLVEKERLGVNMPLLNEMAMYDDLLTLTNNQKAIYKEMLQSFDGIVGADEELPADKKKLLDSIQEDVKRACEAELAYKQAKTIVYSQLAIQTQAPEAEAFRQQVIDLQTARDTASSSTEPNSNTTDKKKFVKGPATRDIDIPKMWQAPTIGFIQDIPQYQNWNPAPVEPTTPSRPQVQQSAQFGSDVTNVQRNSQTQQSNTGAAVPFATHQGNMAPVYTNMSPASLQHMMMGQGSGAMPFVQGGITGNMGMGNMGNMGMQMGQSVISPPAYGVMGPPPPPGSSSYGNNPSYGGAFREQFDAIQTTPQRSYGNRGGRGGRGRGQARREHGGSMGSGQSWSHSPQVYGYEGRRYSDASSQAQQTPFRGKRRSQQNRGDHSSEESYAGRFSDADLTPRPTGSRHISENDLNPLYQASEVSDKHKRGRSPSRRFSQAETESLAPVNSTSMSAQVPTVHGHPDVEKASSTEMPKIPQPVFESSKMSETTETAKDDLRTFTAYNVTSTVFDTLTADTPSEEQQLPSKEDMSTSDIRKAESDEAPKAVVAKAKSVSPYEPRKYNAQAKDAKTAEKAPEWEVVTSKKPKGTTKAPSKPVETTSEPKDSKLPKQRGNGGNDNRTKAVGRKAKGRSGDNKPSPKKEAEADKTDATLEFAADMNSEMDFPSLGGPSTAQRKVVPDYSGYMSHDPKAEEHTASTWAEALRSQNIRAEAESLRPESQLSHYSDMTDIPAHICTPKPEGSTEKLRPTAKEFTPYTPPLAPQPTIDNQETNTDTPKVDRKGKGKVVEPETADLTTAEDVPKVDRKGKGKMVEREFSPTAVDVQTLARKLCDASAKVKISLTAPTSTGTIAMVATLPVTPPAASSSAPVSRAESVKSAASSQRSLPSKLATAPALSYAQRLTSGTKTWDLSSRPEHQINNRRLANASADSAGADSFKSDSGSSNDSPKGGRRPGAKPGSSARVGLGTDMERTSSRSKGKLAKNTSGRSTLIAERMTTPAKIATGLPASGTSWAAKAASAPKLGATVQKTGPAAPPPNPVSAVSQNTSSFRPAFRPAAASTTASQLSSGDSWAARLKTPYKPTTTLGGQSLTGPAGEIGGRGASALGTPATADRSKLRGLSWRATESPQKVAPAQEAGAIAKGPGSGGRLAETGKGTAGPSHKGETEWQTVGGQKAKAKTQQISEKEVGNSSKKPITGDDTESVADCDKPIPSIETYQASEATGTGESGESGDVKTEVTAESVLQRSTFNWADEMDDEDF